MPTCLIICQVSAWGGYVFIINLIPLHVFFLLLMGRFSFRIYVGMFIANYLFIPQPVSLMMKTNMLKLHCRQVFLPLGFPDC